MKLLCRMPHGVARGARAASGVGGKLVVEMLLHMSILVGVKQNLPREGPTRSGVRGMPRVHTLGSSILGSRNVQFAYTAVPAYADARRIGALPYGVRVVSLSTSMKTWKNQFAQWSTTTLEWSYSVRVRLMRPR